MPERKGPAMERRDFVKKSMNAGIAAWTAASAGRVFGANERLRVGLIGCGGRGTFDARLMRGTPEDIQAVASENYHDGNLDPRLKDARNVEIAALCDVYESKIAAAQRWAPAARTFPDFRSLLADKDIDAVIVATMDQWHASMLILACDAGKDVYLEKPVMYRVAEAKAMIEAVRRPELGRLARARAQGPLQSCPPHLPVLHGLYQRTHQRLRKPSFRLRPPDHGSGHSA